MRNVLTNVLGAREQIDIHVAERPLDGGAMLLLCTDGLHGSVDPESLRAILQSAPDVDAAARTLVDAAMERGSRDNVTALVVRWEPDR
jgi:protein phosphatase